MVGGSTPRPAEARPDAGDDRIVIETVTYGQASSQFWTIVRNGIDAAERQINVEVDYRSPDVFDVETMAGMIEAAVARRPDGAVVSIPTPELAPAIRRAVRAGIPVVSINSGSDVSMRLGTLAHIGQPEENAGYRAGQRLAAGAEPAGQRRQCDRGAERGLGPAARLPQGPVRGRRRERASGRRSCSTRWPGSARACAGSAAGRSRTIRRRCWGALSGPQPVTKAPAAAIDGEITPDEAARRAQVALQNLQQSLAP